jgi:hypothetical protein
LRSAREPVAAREWMECEPHCVIVDVEHCFGCLARSLGRSAGERVGQAYTGEGNL